MPATGMPTAILEVANPTHPCYVRHVRGTPLVRRSAPSRNFDRDDFVKLTSHMRTKLTRAARMGVKGAPRLWVELVAADVDGVGNAAKAPRTATV